MTDREFLWWEKFLELQALDGSERKRRKAILLKEREMQQQ